MWKWKCTTAKNRIEKQWNVFRTIPLKNNGNISYEIA
jgi:hypothetical protein